MAKSKSEFTNASSSVTKATAVAPAIAYIARRPDATHSRLCVCPPYSEAATP